MNIIHKLKFTINEAMKLDGDLIDFRIGQGTTFCQLAFAAYKNDRMAYGIDTFEGLPEPTINDLHNHYYPYRKGLHKYNEDAAEKNMSRLLKNSNTNYKIFKGQLDDVKDQLPDTKYAFALLDTLQFEPTQKALDYLWEKMKYGGVIFVLNYENKEYSSDLAISNFIKKHDEQLIYTHQLIVDNVKEKHFIIKCFNEQNKPLSWKKYIPTKKSLTVAMVLRTGGKTYNNDYVNALANGIRKHSKSNFEIVCLTDSKENFNSNVDRVEYFRHDWPSWWGKIELFRDDIFKTERVFYFDLDTLIVDNIDEILDFDVEFSGLRDFYHLDRLGSGLLTFYPKNTTNIYNRFVNKADSVMRNYRYGDQEWIDENKPSITYLQDRFSNQIISYKKNIVKKQLNKIPNNAKIICFHGNPRPHSIKDEWITKHWIK